MRPIVIPISSGGLTVDGVVQNYLVAAGESISIGDFVSFVNTDGGYAHKNKTPELSLVGAAGTPFFSTGILSMSAVALSNTAALVAFRPNSDGGYRGYHCNA